MAAESLRHAFEVALEPKEKFVSAGEVLHLLTSNYDEESALTAEQAHDCIKLLSSGEPTDGTELMLDVDTCVRILLDNGVPLADYKRSTAPAEPGPDATLDPGGMASSTAPKATHAAPTDPPLDEPHGMTAAGNDVPVVNRLTRFMTDGATGEEQRDSLSEPSKMTQLFQRVQPLGTSGLTPQTTGVGDGEASGQASTAGRSVNQVRFAPSLADESVSTAEEVAEEVPVVSRLTRFMTDGATGEEQRDSLSEPSKMTQLFQRVQPLRQ